MIKRDKDGTIKPTATVWHVIHEYFWLKPFDQNAIFNSVRAEGGDVVDTMPDRPLRATITKQQIRNVLNRGSFKQDDLPTNVWTDTTLRKLGGGQYAWGSKI